MSRSVHTDPKCIRGPRRVGAPHAPRREGDRTGEWAIARALKAMGISVSLRTPAGEAPNPTRLPRLVVKRAPKGYRHVVSRSEVIPVLRFFGEACTYGLREIVLAAGPAPDTTKILFGRLIVPGQVVLYPPPPAPWCLAGRLPAKQRRKLERAGAVLESAGKGAQTIVKWSGNDLRDFMLFEVLMHEIGHHLIQHHKGKRRVRTARTKDHEAFADRFAARCRKLWTKTQAAPK